MERAFIVSDESELGKDIIKYDDLVNSQKRFINKIFAEYGIDGDHYQLRGNGFVNRPFKENDGIILYIEGTENNMEKFGKIMRAENSWGLRPLRVNSKLNKEIAQRCVDEEVVVNIYEPRMGDYFKSINYHGASWARFKIGDVRYLKVKSYYLSEDETPEGFTEIKLSEFHKAQEEFEDSIKSKTVV